MGLEINALFASTDEISILKGLQIQVNPGEVHAIMGPNGAGKSTFAKVVAGHEAYEVEKGSVTLDGKDLLELDPEERVHEGLFVSFQYPIEIPGLTNLQFLHAAYNAKQKALGEEQITLEVFEKEVIEPLLTLLKIDGGFLTRAVNEGFSGGEKKRNEILQMAVLSPKYAILDETDSGLDIDALKAVSDGINHLIDQNKGLILITHYQRLLDYVKPDFVHIMIDGKIVRTGGYELAQELEKVGYEAQEVMGNS
ncbi:MAG: putative ATP-dependent transporter SufC [Chlamydiia bacterium]|nr:putative ATP-dependent transporter SufC [Chlamydiia bacterium]